MELIGNEYTRRQLEVAIKASKVENRSIPHMLFTGAAGCGKTSMVKKVAETSGSGFIPTLHDSLSKSKDVWDLMKKLNRDNYNKRGDRTGEINPSIVFIDEIHNLPLKTQEVLGVAMENFMLESARAGRFVWLPYFTIVGATTNDGKLSKPFRDRFKMKFIFSPYSIEESMDIVLTHARESKICITNKAVFDIAIRGRGIPRILVGYLDRVKDFAISKNIEVITETETRKTFEEMKIDKTGLSITDIKLLKALYNSDKPIGQDNLSIITNEAQDTISSTVEPYLIQIGFITRTGRGREITEKGKRYLEDNGYEGSSNNDLLYIDPTYTRR